jgi:hypothetical protein
LLAGRVAIFKFKLSGYHTYLAAINLPIKRLHRALNPLLNEHAVNHLENTNPHCRIVLVQSLDIQRIRVLEMLPIMPSLDLNRRCWQINFALLPLHLNQFNFPECPDKSFINTDISKPLALTMTARVSIMKLAAE